MPRTPRLEYAGAVYHVTARGMLQRRIFVDDRDRIAFLTILGQQLVEHDCEVFAYCLMENHCHLVLRTRLPNLSAFMQAVNGRYGSAFNVRNERRGHVFDGRFKALHVDRDAYLLEVCRYVDLNPVSAAMTAAPAQWRWSSYRSHVGLRFSPEWLATGELHGALAGTVPANAVELAKAGQCYAEWVEAGRAVRLWDRMLRCGAYFGDDAFIERVKSLAGPPFGVRSGSGPSPDRGGRRGCR